MDFIKQMLLKPLLQRLGTIGATALVVGGDWLCQHWNACGLVSQEGAEVVARWCVAAALVCVDLAFVWFERRRSAKR